MGCKKYFDLITLKGILRYIQYIAMFIKENYDKEQEVKTVHAQKQSYTSVDVASCFQSHVCDYLQKTTKLGINTRISDDVTSCTSDSTQ